MSHEKKSASLIPNHNKINFLKYYLHYLHKYLPVLKITS